MTRTHVWVLKVKSWGDGWQSGTWELGVIKAEGWVITEDGTVFADSIVQYWEKIMKEVRESLVKEELSFGGVI